MLKFFKWLKWLWDTGHDPEVGNTELRELNESIKVILKQNEKAKHYDNRINR